MSKRLLLLATLLSLCGCGTFLNPNCWGGTPVEKPCFCHASSSHGVCQPATPAATPTKQEPR